MGEERGKKNDKDKDLLRSEKSFYGNFREVIRKIGEVFRSCHEFSEAFGCGQTHSDPFGPIEMYSDAFGSSWKRSDVFVT